MKEYLDSLQYILDNGVDREDRTGTGTRSVFAYQMRFNLQDGFPAMTTKKLAWLGVKSELLWFLEGSTDERRLAEIRYGKPREQLEDKTTIWTDNAKSAYWTPYATYDGDLGRVYGAQWRSWYKDKTHITGQEAFNDAINVSAKLHNEGFTGQALQQEYTRRYKEVTSPTTTIDQIAEVIQNIKDKPWDRRHIVTAWCPSDIDRMALPPCHMIFQFYVANNQLSCHMNQRSADMFLGVPFNIASYALLTHMIAQVCELDVGELVITLGDAHIYNNHFDQVKEQLERTPFSLPILKLDSDIKDIDSFTMDSIELEHYESHRAIKATMAV